MTNLHPTIDYEFFLPGTPAAAVALRHVERDARQATISMAKRFYYQFARTFMPLSIRQRLQRMSRPKLPHDWYLPEEFMQAWLRSLEGLGPLTVLHPWPHGAAFALVLTHDLETEAGLRDAIALADMEESLGFRSSFNVVPHKYPVDHGILRELQSRGFEIGIHGYNHDGKLYSSRATFDRRSAPINAALHQFDAVGFRSPMVHRNLQWLQQLNVDYECSCFDIDPLQAMPGGIGSLWPFRAGRFIELPYTLPQDHSLWVVLGQTDNRIWAHKLRYVAERNGMALMLTHPDYMRPRRYFELYRDFLLHAQAYVGYWHALPREVAQWWRERSASQVQGDVRHGWTVSGPVGESGMPAELQVSDGRLTITPLATRPTLPLIALRHDPADPHASEANACPGAPRLVKVKRGPK